MLDIRCECGKITCQSDHEFIIIKCRHCKRFMYIKMDDVNQKAVNNLHSGNISNSHNRQYSKHI